MNSLKHRPTYSAKITLRDYKGDLHVHSKSAEHPSDTPDEIVEKRQGSNCGQIPLKFLLEYHSKLNEGGFMAFTDHSRDGSPQDALSGVTNWFAKKYLGNKQWLQQEFGISEEDDLTDDIKEKIKALAAWQAKKLVSYDDRRLEKVWQEIDKLQLTNPEIKIFKGIEASLLPSGKFDSQLVDSSDKDVVICSIHPKLDKEKFDPIIEDAQKYTALVIKGIKNKQTNIFGHIGYGVKQEIIENLDWEAIAQAAIENQVALEINLKEVIKFIYNQILDYEKYPLNSTAYRSLFAEKLSTELLPAFIRSEQIVSRLKPYFTAGLKVAINTDEHRNKFIKIDTTSEEVTADFLKRDLRFWRALKIIEKYFNKFFERAGISRQNIINTFDVDKLQSFLDKEPITE